MKKINTVFLFVYVFLLLYQPPILSVNVLHFLSIIPIAYFMLKNKRERVYIPQNYKIFIKLNLLFFVLAVVLNVVNKNYLNIYTLFLYIIELQICVIFIVSYTREYEYDIFDMCIYSGIFEAGISCITFFFPWFQEKIISLCISNGYPNETEWFIGKRFYGLSSQLTFTMPVLQIVLAIVVIERFMSRKDKNKFLLIIESMILIFSAIINARISLVIFFLGMIYIVVKYHNRIKCRHYILSVVTILFIIYLVRIVSPKTFCWIYEGIKEIITLPFADNNEGYFYTLFNKFIFFPKSIIGFLFGEGIFVFNTQVGGMNSDVGFIIDIWMYGFLGMSLKYLSFLIGLIRSRTDKLFSIWLLSICFLCNVKGPVFETNELVAFISLYLATNRNVIMKNEK